MSRPLHRKPKILWQLENLQNYEDLYGKPLERDWRAKRLLLIQILLISSAHKNSPLKDINLKICMYIVYVIESAAYGVLFTSCLCQKPERARYERVRAFDTNNG